MKHLKTFESFQINEGLLDSFVYRFLQDDDNYKKMSTASPKQTFVKNLLAATIFRKPDEPVGVIPEPEFKSYVDLEVKDPDKKIDGVVDLSDLTLDDYKKAVEMGKSNRWANPSGNLVGIKPKFFKEADEKTKKAYKFIYQAIDKSVKSGTQYTPGS